MTMMVQYLTVYHSTLTPFVSISEILRQHMVWSQHLPKFNHAMFISLVMGSFGIYLSINKSEISPCYRKKFTIAFANSLRG